MISWSFRKTTILPTSGASYGGWEALNIDLLRGQFVEEKKALRIRLLDPSLKDSMLKSKEKMMLLLAGATLSECLLFFCYKEKMLLLVLYTPKPKILRRSPNKQTS